jgi:hypothetical protein
MKKTEQHVSQAGADMALQLMLMTLFRIVADLGDDPDGFISGVRTALLELAALKAPLSRLEITDTGCRNLTLRCSPPASRCDGQRRDAADALI